MPRYKITIEYNGTNYSGWQRQDVEKSVQGEVESAVFKFSGEQVNVQCSGRTDAGVHALGQVAHFDIVKEIASEKVQGALNYYLLGKEIAIIAAEEVGPEFNARFSSLKRSYQYKILNRRPPSVLQKDRVWHVKEKLDLEKMQEAAKCLIGHHDFTSFRASACQAKSAERTLDKIEIYQEGEMIFFDLEARSFLHHMVRNIVGTLKLVGNGNLEPQDVQAILESKDRKAAGPTAPACGLYFVGVEYS